MIYKYLNKLYGSVIKIDIDKPYLPFYTKNGLKYLSRFYSIQKLIIKKSPSKKGFHVIVCLKEKLPSPQILNWQFACGSDKFRERFNLLRLSKGNKMENTW
jgi:hypothetical protein